MLTYKFTTKNGCHWLCARSGKKIAGYCTYSCNKDVVTLWTIMVNEKFRGKGYGREMLTTLLESLPKTIKHLELVVLGDQSNKAMMALISKYTVVRYDRGDYLLRI